MKLILVRQATVVPLAAMLTPILIAFTLPGYSSISQHISEVALLDHPIAIVQRCAATVTGLSILLFGIGLVLLAPGRFRFTAVAATAFAASMISNGIVVMGSPLHGLYGLGLFMVLVPAFFAAELPQEWHGQRIRSLSMLAALLNLVYMWLMLSGLESAKFAGLTQRVATVIVFVWYAFAGYGALVGVNAHAKAQTAPAVT